MSDHPGTEAIELSLFDLSPGPFFLRLAYLLTALPLGILYFAFLSAGISLSLGLAIIWIGIPILAIVMTACLALAEFERRLTASLLGLEIPKPLLQPTAEAGFWEALKSRLSDSCTWKSLLFLLLKLPLGIASFTLALTAAISSLALTAVPFVYEAVPVRIGFRSVSTWDEALLCGLAGIALAGATVALVNGLAWLWRWVASALLGPSEAVSAPSPATPQAPLTIR